MRREALVPSAVSEFEGLDLGDRRRSARALRLVEAMQKDPAAGFPSAVSTIAEREGNYRLLNNRRVDMASLMAPHVARTVERARALEGRPLVVIDPTTFVFGGESEREGLDRFGKTRQGFETFVALAVSHSREPLGVVSIRPVKSKGRIGANEWRDAISSVHDVAGSLKPISVIDREGDAYALFANEIARGDDFVIRVAHDRWVQEHDGAANEMLRDIAERAPALLSREVKLARRSGVGKAPKDRRQYPPREGREATLTVRACAVTLPRPRNLKKIENVPASITVNLVQVIEEQPPEGEPGVEWLLFTTLPIDTPEAVAYTVDAYRARWTIEEYFKALKTGCRYENRELESLHALQNALGILAVLAWRLLALRSCAADETAKVDRLLDDDELYVLRKMSKDVKLGSDPTARDALLAIAILGGHFKQNGRPGWQVIWRGFRKLLERVEGYRLARAEI